MYSCETPKIWHKIMRPVFSFYTLLTHIVVNQNGIYRFWCLIHLDLFANNIKMKSSNNHKLINDYSSLFENDNILIHVNIISYIQTCFLFNIVPTVQFECAIKPG